MASRLDWTLAITPAQVLCAKFSPDGQHLFLAGSEDSSFMDIATDKPNQNYKTGPTVDVFKEGIYDLAVNKSGNKIVTCSNDHDVKVVDFPDTNKQKLVTRFDVAATCVAFSSCESFIAAGSEAGDIKIVTIVGESAVRKWKAHQGCVKGLAFDPQRRYLVSTGEDGMICVWDYADNDKKVWSSSMLPQTSLKLSQLSRPAWDATGSRLAVPTYTGIALLERDSWKEIRRLQEHKAEVLALDWSPNGTCMISSHNDNSFVVWDLAGSSGRGAGGESLDRLRHTTKIISVAWHPKRNAVALLDENGHFAVWENVVQGNKKKDPVKDTAPKVAVIDEFEKKKQSVSSLFDTDTPMEDSSNNVASSSSAAATQDSLAPLEPLDRRAAMDRLVQRQAQAEANATDKIRESIGLGSDLVDPDDPNHPVTQQADDDGMAVDSQAATPADATNATAPAAAAAAAAVPLKPRQAAAAARRRPGAVMRPPADWAPIAKLQAPFQPNSSPYAERRRYLCWNDIGLISCRYDESGTSHLEIDFSDQGRNRNFTSNRSLRIRHAALGNHGIAMSSEGEVGVAGSVVFYEAYDSLGPNADWQRDLGTGEVAEAIAIGNGFIAVATSNHSVRIFSESGLQKHVFTLPAPIVTLVARGSLLAAFYHLGAPFGSVQNMGFSLWNVPKQAELLSHRPAPLSANATLTWVGFSMDENVLTTLDSAGIFRQLAGFDSAPVGSGSGARAPVFGASAPFPMTTIKSDSPNWSGTWAPVLDVSNIKQLAHFWPITLTKEKMRWVPCVAMKAAPTVVSEAAAESASTTFYAPVVMPRPVPSSTHLSSLLLNTESQVGALEESHLRSKISYNYMKYRVIEEVANADGTDLDDSWRENKELQAAQVAIDQTMLRIIQSSCESDRVDRALDCVSELFLRKSLQIASQIAVKTFQNVLASRLTEQLRREIEASNRQKNRSVLGYSASTSSFNNSSTQDTQYNQRRQQSSEEEDDDDQTQAAAPPPAKRAKVTASASPRKHSSAISSLYSQDTLGDDAATEPAATIIPDDDEEDLTRPILKSKSDDAMDVDAAAEDSTPKPAVRAINPFAKASTKPTTSTGSIFDTIQGMKQAKEPTPAAAAAPAGGSKKKGTAAAAGKKGGAAGGMKKLSLFKTADSAESAAPAAGDVDEAAPEADKSTEQESTDANKKKRKLFS